MQVVIKKLQDIKKSELDGFLLKNSNTLLYTSYSFLWFLENYLKAECFITVCRNDEGEITGIFPYVISEEKEYGRICNSLPYYGSNGGIIIDEKVHPEKKVNLRTEILDETLSFIKKFDLASVTFITNPLDPEGNEFLKEYFPHDLVDERIGQVTHFPENENNIEDTLMKSFEDPRPRNIRKAIKTGIKIYFTNDEDSLDFLFDVHKENITSIGGKPKTKDFFRSIPVYFTKHQYKVYIAELDGEKIAAVLLFYFNNTVEYFTPAIIDKYRDAQPTALIIYRAMLDAVKGGYKYWNWGGTWLVQKGVYDFKKKWGTTDHPYYYYIKIYNKEIITKQKELLNSMYEYFYVLPFNKLSPAVKETE